MGELTDYFLERFKKSDSETKDKMNKQKVKNAISSICEQYLLDADDVLEFEVSNKDLPYAVEVIYEEPIRSKYVINQISATMFSAVLKEIEL